MLTLAPDIDWSATRADFERDGVVCLRQLLDQGAMASALDAFTWSLGHPGPLAVAPEALATPGSRFYSDLSNFSCIDAYRPMLETSPLPAAVADLWAAQDVWMLYEQVFLREGAKTQRTPWHQDSSYIPIGGRHVVVAWITFDPATEADCLEFVRGSHKGAVYNRPAVGDGAQPADGDRLATPDIEAEREKWDIVSFDITPGDVVLFHIDTLHGGSATEGQRRRTLSLRFFGPDASYVPITADYATPLLPGFHERMRAGQPFRDPAFLKLLPR